VSCFDFAVVLAFMMAWLGLAWLGLAWLGFAFLFFIFIKLLIFFPVFRLLSPSPSRV
jgi:hypothetical protein